MKKLLLPAAVLVFFVSGLLFAQQTIEKQTPAAGQAEAIAPAALPVKLSAKDPNIRYLGRWDTTDPAAPRASWPYSSVTVKFQGTAINGRLKGGGYYQVVVDGKPAQVLFLKDGNKDGNEVYELAKGLSKGEHVVEVVRRNEGASAPPLVILGFQLEQGSKLVPLPPRSERRILVIGDSISCGYGNEALLEEHNPMDKQNAYLTYGAIAARKLNAEAQIIAWSGRKLFPDHTIVEVYDRALPGQENPKADLAGWAPGVVLIDLGTNDFRDRKNEPDQQGWINAYKGFIQRIRKTAPDSFVFVASGSMGVAPDWDAWARTVVADLQQAGDKKIAYLRFAQQDGKNDGLGGDYHPNLKTHAKMAEKLVQEIGNAVGWK
jgi:lysophospholipase L1-like esterase